MLDDVEVVANVIYKPTNRHTYFRVTPPNVLIITTPRVLTYEDVIKITTLNKKKIKSFIKSPSDKLHLLGKEYNLHILPGQNRMEVINDDIYIYAVSDDKNTIQKIVDRFYTKELEKIVENNIEVIKMRWGFTEPLQIKYKHVSSYFGECFYKRNLIILSTKLAKYDVKYIINVINHEMCHFYVHNHSERFYTTLELKFPGFTTIQRNLKRIHYNDLY